MEWEIKNKDAGFNQELISKYPEVLLRLLKNRGIVSEEQIENFFNFDYERNVSDPLAISGMKEAVERIGEALSRQEKVAIFGDYDADGVTATALLFDVLGELGFEDVCYYIPDRQLEGYGMNKKAVDYLKSIGTSLIITVDCGITNIEEVRKAKELGIDVIVTDHHHVPSKLPDALSIINPNMPDAGFSSSDLAGVGVAFKLAQALYKVMMPAKIDQLKWALDLVAIGTIADCVPILGENRALVKYGLIVLSKTRKIGLQELYKVGRIDISNEKVPDTQKVAFQIAPRINAAGRMDHASASYKLMIERDRPVARTMALEVEAKNQERQKVTAEIAREVKVIADQMFREKKIVIAANSHWPVGILGLIAGKIAEEYKKPTVVMRQEENEYIASLRSIPEVNLMEVLEGCSSCLSRFGGHAQAAGLRVAKDKVESFYEEFEKIVEDKLKNTVIKERLEIDAEISHEEISWETMKHIEKMAPFGVGNGEPVFVSRGLTVAEKKVVGNGSKHLKLALRAGSSPKIFDSIGFGLGEKFTSVKPGDRLDLVFNLRSDEWNGNRKLQFRIIDLRLSQ